MKRNLDKVFFGGALEEGLMNLYNAVFGVDDAGQPAEKADADTQVVAAIHVDIEKVALQLITALNENTEEAFEANGGAEEADAAQTDESEPENYRYKEELEPMTCFDK